MVMKKTVIAGCIDRIFEFINTETAAEYLEALRAKKKVFRIVSRDVLENGVCRIRIQEQYNNSPLIDEN